MVVVQIGERRRQTRRDRCRAGWRSRTSARCRNGIHRPRSRSTAAAWPVAGDRRHRRRSGRARGSRPDRRPAARCRTRRPNKSRRGARRHPAESVGRCRRPAVGSAAAPVVENEKVVAAIIESDRYRVAGATSRAAAARPSFHRISGSAAPAPRRCPPPSLPSRTCSGPDRMSTMRPRSARRALRPTGMSDRQAGCCSTAVPLITPAAPGGFRAGPGSASPATSTSFHRWSLPPDHARRSFRTGLRFAAARHGVKLKPMADEFVAELSATISLQLFDFLVAEFDHPTGLQVDQMVVVVRSAFPRSGSARRRNRGVRECWPLQTASQSDTPWRC